MSGELFLYAVLAPSSVWLIAWYLQGLFILVFLDDEYTPSLFFRVLFAVPVLTIVAVQRQENRQSDSDLMVWLTWGPRFVLSWWVNALRLFVFVVAVVAYVVFAVSRFLIGRNHILNSYVFSLIQRAGLHDTARIEELEGQLYESQAAMYETAQRAFAAERQLQVRRALDRVARETGLSLEDVRLYANDASRNSLYGGYSGNGFQSSVSAEGLQLGRAHEWEAMNGEW